MKFERGMMYRFGIGGKFRVVISNTNSAVLVRGRVEVIKIAETPILRRNVYSENGEPPVTRGRIYNFSGFGVHCIHISNTLSVALVGGIGWQ